MAAAKPYRSRKGNKWVAPVRSGPDLQRTTLTVDGWDEAQKLVRESDNAHHALREFGSPEMLAESADKFLAVLKDKHKEAPYKPGRKTDRWEDDEYSIKAHIKVFFEGVATRDVTVFNLHQFRDYLMDPELADLSLVSSNGVFKVLKRIFLHAQGREVIKYNPLVDYKKSDTVAFFRASRPARPTALSLGQVRKLLDGARTRERLMIYIMLLAGLRSGEAIALLWRHVDFVNGGVWIFESGMRFSVDKEKKIMRTAPTKTHAGARFIPATPRLLAEFAAAKNGVDPDSHVLVDRSGNGITYQALTYRLRALQNFVAGVPAEVHPERGDSSASNHTFRHTCVALWIAAGISFDRIAIWIGHHSKITTIKCYGHLIRDPAIPSI